MDLNTLVSIFLGKTDVTPDAVIEVLGFTRVAFLTLLVTFVFFAARNGFEFYKQYEDRRKWNHAEKVRLIADQRIADEALWAVKRGLAEQERHHWENQLVIRTMKRRMDGESKIPLEYQIDRLSILPLPRFLQDDQIARLDADKALHLTKMQRMVPNFEREYNQAAKLLRDGKTATFRAFLNTLDIKADVGMRFANRIHQEIFGEDLTLHPDRSPTGSTKPLDFYEDDPADV